MSKYIKKDLLKLAVIEMLNEPPFSEKKFERADALIKVIDGFPAADVEPVVRGEWTMLTADLTDWSRETYVHWLKCSLCGKAVHLRSKSKFCPHCGAHMVERQCAMPFKTQSVEEEKKACADYFERAERSGSGE